MRTAINFLKRYKTSRAVVQKLWELKNSVSSKQKLTGKPVLCFNLDNIDFEKAAGVPNFTKVWLPFLVRHHRVMFHLRYSYSGVLPSDMKLLLENNKVDLLREGAKCYQFNFHQFQKRIPSANFVMTFVHDFHVFTVPWKYDIQHRHQKNLLNNLYYADAVASYFPFTVEAIKSTLNINAIKLPQFLILDHQEHGDSEAARQILKIDETVLFYPSDCQVHKNHFNLLKSVKVLKDQGVDVHLVLTGFTEENQACLRGQALIEELGINDLVTWFPRLTDVDVVELYRASDIVVQPSLAEGGAMIALEGCVFGKSICVADIPQARSALSELSIEPEWFDPLKPIEMAAAISRAIDSPKNVFPDVMKNIDLAAAQVSKNWKL